jgi:hypothetical protein
MGETTMTQETMLQKTERAMALVGVLQAERDKAIAELKISRAELEHTKDELNREKAMSRLRDMKMRRLKMRQQAT